MKIVSITYLEVQLEVKLEVKLYAWCLSYVKKSAKTEERFLIYRARKFLLTSAEKYAKNQRSAWEKPSGDSRLSIFTPFSIFFVVI